MYCLGQIKIRIVSSEDMIIKRCDSQILKYPTDTLAQLKQFKVLIIFFGLLVSWTYQHQLRDACCHLANMIEDLCRL